MQTANQMSLKTIFLYTLIGSVSISALLGILVILIGDFGEFEARVLLTSLTISGASLCGLSCGAALEAQRQPTLPFAGIALAVLAAILIILGIWVEYDSDDYWKTAATVGIFAVSCSQMSLLLLARLVTRYTWSLWAAAVAIFGVALIITVMLWGEIDAEPMFRILGVAAILDGAFTLLIPIFHRLGRDDMQADAATEVERTSVMLSDVDREIAQLQKRLEELQSVRSKLVRRHD